jgi:glycosyltransferase involved in cell wall biosynthesis
MPCKLSVITPVFNGIRFIEFCIRNVIDQHCPDAEHIIIDGGSTDGTVEIIRQYADDYPHIHWISENDRGQSDAMNKGIGMASGSILGILNVDDYYEPGVLNEILDIFRSLPEPSLLVGNCNVWDDDDNLLFVSRPCRISYLNLLMQYMKAFPPNPAAYFYHKSLHGRIELYDVDEHFAMDVHFILKAVQVAHIKKVNRLWGNWRFLSGTKTFRDVESGENRRRVAAIYASYRKQAPLHYRIFSSIVVNLVKAYNVIKYAAVSGNDAK